MGAGRKRGADGKETNGASVSEVVMVPRKKQERTKGGRTEGQLD